MKSQIEYSYELLMMLYQLIHILTIHPITTTFYKQIGSQYGAKLELIQKHLNKNIKSSATTLKYFLRRVEDGNEIVRNKQGLVVFRQEMINNIENNLLYNILKLKTNHFNNLEKAILKASLSGDYKKVDILNQKVQNYSAKIITLHSSYLEFVSYLKNNK